MICNLENFEKGKRLDLDRYKGRLIRKFQQIPTGTGVASGRILDGMQDSRTSGLQGEPVEKRPYSLPDRFTFRNSGSFFGIDGISETTCITRPSGVTAIRRMIF